MSLNASREASLTALGLSCVWATMWLSCCLERELQSWQFGSVQNCTSKTRTVCQILRAQLESALSVAQGSYLQGIQRMSGSAASAARQVNFQSQIRNPPGEIRKDSRELERGKHLFRDNIRNGDRMISSACAMPPTLREGVRTQRWGEGPTWTRPRSTDHRSSSAEMIISKRWVYAAAATAGIGASGTGWRAASDNGTDCVAKRLANKGDDIPPDAQPGLTLRRFTELYRRASGYAKARGMTQRYASVKKRC